MTRTDRRLFGLARDFADSIQRVLNATICNNVRISTVVSPTPSGTASVGFGLTKSIFRASRFQVSIRPGGPQCWLEVGFRVRLDDAGDYLMIEDSYIAVYATDDEKMWLCRFDYERGKQGYPEAHLQVSGESAALGTWGGGSRNELDRLHFPVGGRRFRPALEDIVEFLIVEGLVEARAGWRDVLNAERDAYRRIQLRAAIRRDPETAFKALSDLVAA